MKGEMATEHQKKGKGQRHQYIVLMSENVCVSVVGIEVLNKEL